MDNTDITLIGICDLVGKRDHTAHAEYDTVRKVAWLTLRGQPVSVVKLPGAGERWRVLTRTVDAKITTYLHPDLAAAAITRIADGIASSEAQPVS